MHAKSTGGNNMGEFSEHVKILTIAMIFFMVAFVIAYSKGWEKVWISIFIVLIILFMTIAILARWSSFEISQTD